MRVKCGKKVESNYIVHRPSSIVHRLFIKLTNCFAYAYNIHMHNLKLKCQKCNKLFRTENGLAWHLLHRHEFRDIYEKVKKQISLNEPTHWTIRQKNESESLWEAHPSTIGKFTTKEEAEHACDIMHKRYLYYAHPTAFPQYANLPDPLLE